MKRTKSPLPSREGNVRFGRVRDSVFYPASDDGLKACASDARADANTKGKNTILIQR